MNTIPAVESLASQSPSHRRDEIRQVAASLFEASGYSATTMTDIAAAVGILPGSLYHHFASKEEIAVEILSDLEQDIAQVAATILKRLPEIDGGPEERIRYVAGEVATLSVRRGAALRLYAYEAPSVATERFRSALRLEAPALDKAWKRALAGLDAGPGKDVGLLRFAISELSLNIGTEWGGRADNADLSREMCDLVLEGLVVDCPDDATLDASDALAAARDAVAGWQPFPEPSGGGSREDIIAAARIEFARRSYHATTIRDIAEAAGVRMGTLYRRVESKDEILAEILANYGSSLGHAFQAALATGDSLAESLDALAYVFVSAKRLFRRESEIVRFGWRGRESANDPFHHYYHQTQSRLQLLEQLLDRGVAEGSVRPVGPSEDLGHHIRSVIWLPFQDYRRTSVPRAHQFVRESLLRGFLTA